MYTLCYTRGKIYNARFRSFWISRGGQAIVIRRQTKGQWFPKDDLVSLTHQRRVDAERNRIYPHNNYFTHVNVV